jgi:uncharacterized protein YkwD
MWNHPRVAPAEAFKKGYMKKSFFLPFLFAIIILSITSCSAKRPQAVKGSSPVITDTPFDIQSTPTSTLSDMPTAVPTLTPTELPSPTPTTQGEALPSPTPTESPSPATVEILPSPTPEAQNANAQASNPSDQTCIDKASFSDDVTIPDGTLVHIGETFTKTWKIRNEGTCDWVGYNLIYAGGEAMNSPMSVPLQEIKPGQFANISVQLQAPERGGSHTGYWQFQNAAGKSFGVGAGADGLIWAQITVDYPTQVPAPQATSSQNTSAQSSNSQTSTTQNTASNTTASGCEYTRNTDYESQIVSLVNEARAQNGLAPLTLDSQLSAAAMVHSIDMACNDMVSHSGSDGSSWYDRVKAQGFANFTSTRENIYVGNPAFGGDAQGAFTWWMNSKIHHDNILFPTVTVIGVGYAYTSTSTYGGYYTLELARK